MNFIGFYGVLLEFEKRMSVNMQEINSKPWIMGRIMEGAKITVSSDGELKTDLASGCLKSFYPLSKKWVMHPFVPPENWLKVAIRAGEKKLK